MDQSHASSAKAFKELERGVRAALETYSNVHRGTGHHSMVSTALYERAREVVLAHLELDPAKYVVVFCTPWRSETLSAQLGRSSYRILSSQEVGLPLGIRALAVKRTALPRGVPFQTGGDTVDLVAKRVVWADAPRRYEAGTPSIVNVIAFAKALQLIRRFGSSCFVAPCSGASTAAEILHRDQVWEGSGRELLLELRETLLGRNARVPISDGERAYINMDNGASTPTFAPIWDTVRQVWKLPLTARGEIIGAVREICARFLGAPLDQYEILFCSNTTEALNIVASSLTGQRTDDVESVLVNTLLEHHSNELPWRYVPGIATIRLPVDHEGFLNLHGLERLLRAYNQEHAHGLKRVRVVAVSGASNVLGSYNDIPAIARLAHRYGAHILVDGAQLIAHRSVDVAAAGIDYLAFSGHKMYAPFGSGALVVRKGLLNCSPAELAEIVASGEENLVGIAAMGKAITLLERVGMDVIAAEEQALTRRALRGLSRIPGIEIYGVQDPDSPRFCSKGGILTFSLATVPHNLTAVELAEQGGIGVRNGCFCAHHIVRDLLNIHPIRTFVGGLGLHVARRFFGTILPGAVRVSLGIENDAREVDTLIQVLEGIASAPRSCVDRFIASTHNGTPFLPRTEVQERIVDYVNACAERVYSFNQAV